MSDNKISFGKTKTPEEQPAYVPEQAPENIDNRKVYDFGKKYAVLEYKIKEFKEGAVYTANFDIQPLENSFIFTTTFYNSEGKVLSTESVEVPEGTPIDDFMLDYDNKKLIITTIGGPTIEADISELIDKVELLEQQVGDLNSAVFIDDINITQNGNLNLLGSITVEGDNLNLGEKGEQENEVLILETEKTTAFYDKFNIDTKVANLNYEVSVGTDIVEPERARTWFQPAETEFSMFLTSVPTILEQEVTLNEEPEVNLSSASLDENNTEQTVSSSDDEVNLSGVSLDDGSSESVVGFTDDEYSYSIDSEDTDSEQIPGTSEGDVSSGIENNEVEFIPGFSENEIG
jgi:hypothetical protein